MTFEEVSLLFSAVVAISTLIYAVLTWRLVSETRTLRKVQTEPRLSIYVTPNERSSYLKDLVIKNIGYGPAYDLSFSLKEDFTLYNGKKLSEVGIINKGIKYLAPNQKYEFFLTNPSEKFKELCSHPLSISVKYSNMSSEEYKEEFLIDFSIWENFSTVDKKGLSDIVRNLEAIKTSIDNVERKIR
jgi:hypothetical protein